MLLIGQDVTLERGRLLGVSVRGGLSRVGSRFRRNDEINPKFDAVYVRVLSRVKAAVEEDAGEG